MAKNYNSQAQTTPQKFYISKLKSSARRIAAASGSYKPKLLAGRMELDSHADTIVAGANCTVLEYTGRECDVSPYSSEYSPVTGVPVVKAATVWQSEVTGQEYILVLNQALYMPSLPNSLVNPNQLRAYGTTVQDNPYSSEPLYIQTENKNFAMELHTTGTVIFVITRTPTEEDLQSGDLPLIELSSPHEWDPHSLKFPDCPVSFEDVLTNMQVNISSLNTNHLDFSHLDGDSNCVGSNIFNLGDINTRIISSAQSSNMFGDRDTLTDVPSPPSFTSGNCHTDVSARDLAERWFISLPQAMKTLKKTTQKFIRSALLPLTCQYTADRMFFRKTLAGQWSTDTMDGRALSLSGNIYAQVFSNRGYFSKYVQLRRKMIKNILP